MIVERVRERGLSRSQQEGFDSKLLDKIAASIRTEPGIQGVSNVPSVSGNPAFVQQYIDSLMDFPSTCYKDPVPGGDPLPSHAAFYFA